MNNHKEIHAMANPPRRSRSTSTRTAASHGHRRPRPALVVAAGASILAVVALLAFLGSTGDGGSGTASRESFDLPSLDGDGRVRLADFEGRPVVVNFFASWCTSCDSELPHFRAVSAEVHGEVTFVGVNALESGDPMLMPRRHDITGWPLAADIGPRGNDLHAALGGRGMPITAYYDADGSLVHVDPGAIDEATLRQRLAELFSVET
jgi:thiol-disulfide isomerase/thioredoxin